MSERTKTIVFICGVVLLLSLGAYLGRGWIRGTFIPKSVAMFHAKTVKKRFTQNFEPLSSELDKFGLRFEEPLQARIVKCNDQHYEGFSVDISCAISIGSNTINPDESYRQNWKEHAADLESSLIAQGWKTQRASWPIATLLESQIPSSDDRVSYSTSFQVSYVKKYGKLDRCWLSINYKLYPKNHFPNANPAGDLSISANCLSYKTIF